MNALYLTLRKAVRIGLLFTLACGALASADSITGSVRNETTGRPSVGDQVVLLLQGHGLEKEAGTTTNNEGFFTLPVRLPRALYVIRVMHGNVNYDFPWSSGTAPQIKVYDVARRVSRLTGYATIVKVESDGKNYTVTEMHAVVNDSNPPLTQAGPGNLEICLPQKAEIVSVIAVGPQGPSAGITPVPNPQEPGRYAIGLPLLPGMTRYAIRYRVAWSEQLVIYPRLKYPTRQLSVIFPQSMKFTALGEDEFHRIIDREGVQVQVMNEVKAGKMPGFVLSGSGLLPVMNTAAGAAVTRHVDRPGTAPVPRKTDISRAMHWVFVCMLFIALGFCMFLASSCGPRAVGASG